MPHIQVSQARHPYWFTHPQAAEAASVSQSFRSRPFHTTLISLCSGVSGVMCPHWTNRFGQGDRLCGQLVNMKDTQSMIAGLFAYELAKPFVMQSWRKKRWFICSMRAWGAKAVISLQTVFDVSQRFHLPLCSSATLALDTFFKHLPLSLSTLLSLALPLSLFLPWAEKYVVFSQPG